MTQKIKNALDGKKTHLVAVGLIVLGGAQLLGFFSLTEEQLTGAMTLLGGAGAMAMRAAIDKGPKKNA